MTKETASEEFWFLKSKLEEIMSLIKRGEPADLRMASFMLGCLHTCCISNYEIFKENT